VKKLIFLLAFLLGACFARPTPEPTPTARAPQILSAEENPYAPKNEDMKLIRAGVILTSIHLSERIDLDPARVEVGFLGSMPSVCNDLRLQIEPPDKEYRIFIEAYSVADPNINCENVFQQFETSILLGVYSPGRYLVLVNNQYVGDFISY
jgi:hypothetical protein